MLRKSLLAVAASAASAATWYGIAPDTTIAGQINVFKMAPNGQPLNGVGSIVTQDNEYPKIGTLHCSWNTTMCFFATGVGAQYTQDAILGFDRATGKTAFRHELPAGIFIDNLALDWVTDTLYAVSFDPARRAAVIASWDGKDGNFTFVLDITADLNGGIPFGGTVTVSSQLGLLFVGVDMPPGTPDVVLTYSLATKKLVERHASVFPIPAGLRATADPRNASNTVLLGSTIAAEAMGREVALLVALNENIDRFGQWFPFSEGYLPTFSQRGEIPLFLNGMMSEFQGQFLIPIFPPFQPGPGPAPQLTGGLLWTVNFQPGQPSVQQLSPLNYFLAGASGVPTQ